ncbi:hypothetical protein E2C00_28495 [Streptomyces sp. WAC05374]|uniref:hypothetical protein n=1 Tax=Streptomyces sp. WAC05374 TaxID=2487420 RepID=UPI000F89C5E9|nr:hypothetical protein [Streptomyces sp. WAC05374]RST18484.1 hypothetical protein EF905_05075 [Streptomyces sp. WAC05374]TDF41064.1 hypothetical protein E2B92_22885 [Streptomyces sp. WAC05374]TDF49777.1 hypothetical protein E2C00_28495 [Streptomyces sp. WAC05374]TDF51334.1 hypothetical protein E2C02_23605 [Streptomyces sp. WAC05374]
MPLVFVHGVNNRRSDPGYAKSVRARDSLFRKSLLADLDIPAPVQIFNPYWGDAGATFAWNLACVPTGNDKLTSLGISEGLDFSSIAAVVGTLAAEGEEDSVLTRIAKSGRFVEALDLLWSAALYTADDEAMDGLAELAAASAQLGASDPSPDWLARVNNDGQFVEFLISEVTAHLDAGDSVDTPAEQVPVPLGARFELWDRVRQGATRLRVEVGAFIGKSAWNTARDLAVPTLTRFIGDVLVYQANPQSIFRKVVPFFRDAASMRTDNDPLIVIGHSLGGVISCDLLTGPLKHEISVDLFCSVGSQVGLFEEMKLLQASQHDIPGRGGAKVPLPSNITHWINVFDYNDILSYKLGALVDGVVDYPYETGELLQAHGSYFTQPEFHRRLSLRVQKELR